MSQRFIRFFGHTPSVSKACGSSQWYLMKIIENGAGNRYLLMRPTLFGLALHGLAGDPTGRPGSLQVESPCKAIDIQQFSSKI